MRERLASISNPRIFDGLYRLARRSRMSDDLFRVIYRWLAFRQLESDVDNLSILSRVIRFTSEL